MQFGNVQMSRDTVDHFTQLFEEGELLLFSHHMVIVSVFALQEIIFHSIYLIYSRCIQTR